ncbi:DUF5304 domain-containing protein [Streptomyces sp. NPDC059740]|uniref:DUF5304 domain-containing protein n=1 Tax=Streptomyces sp. NPDC059740 TaxID=3346926 RepID=UPI00365DB3B4
MSDAKQRPADADAWETACAEDLAEERARHRARDTSSGSAAEELRKLAEALGDRLADIQLPASLGGKAAQQAVSHLLNQAKSAVEPVVERNQDVFGHLAAAGSELLAAYRSVVREGERRWTEGAAAARPASAPRPAADQDGAAGEDAAPDTGKPAGGRRDDDGENGGEPGGSERIDLD